MLVGALDDDPLRLDVELRRLLPGGVRAVVVVAGVHPDLHLRVQLAVHLRRRVDAVGRQGDVGRDLVGEGRVDRRLGQGVGRPVQGLEGRRGGRHL